MIIKKICYCLCDAVGQYDLSYKCHYLNEGLVLQIFIIIALFVVGVYAMAITENKD